MVAKGHGSFTMMRYMMKNLEDFTNLGRKAMNSGFFILSTNGKEENKVMLWFNIVAMGQTIPKGPQGKED